MILRRYQVEGIQRVEQILFLRHSAYLADEMGLGKTVEAICVCNDFCAQKILVICPASLRLNWEREFHQWYYDPELLSYTYFSQSDFNRGRLLRNPFVVITSYELASRGAGFDTLTSLSWDFLIIDEAHYCKNKSARRTSAVFGKLWDAANYRLLLSGTPCPNGIIDGFEAFNKLAPECFPDRYKFGHRYTNARRNWFTGYWEFKGGRNLKELRDTLQRTCMVRRTKQNVLLELPPKIYSTIPIKIDFPAGFSLGQKDIERIEGGQAAVMSSQIATARRGLGLLKVDAAVEHVMNIMEAKDRCVVFAYHRDVISALVEKLSKCIPCMQITGDTPMKDRDQTINLFQTAKDLKVVLVGQITAAGVGITLTAADICVFVELDWTPANMAQAIDRLHRIGQQNAVEVHYLVAADTMDDQIIVSLRSKIEAINQALKHQTVKGEVEKDGTQEETCH